jgi:hypothetical protein
MIVVRYADDIVVGFEFKDEAERFWAELKERMRKFQRKRMVMAACTFAKPGMTISSWWKRGGI